MSHAEDRILVVDDMLTITTIVKKLLMALGFENIETAKDGQEALEMVELSVKSGDHYKLIISDWNMPRMQGIDLLVKVKEMDVYKKIPFLMLTAENEWENIRDAISLGVTDYLIKPIDAKILKEKLLKVYKTL